MTSSQLFQTLPIAVLSQAEQGDRWLNTSELNVLSDFFRSSNKRLEIASVLSANSDAIVSAGANRIFFGGTPMNYLERPPNRENLPGYTPHPRRYPVQSEGLTTQLPDFGNPLQRVQAFLQSQFSPDRDPLPSGFRMINVRRYGKVRMQRSMRDLSWFLRYITYAIAAGDHSILTVNVQGLRGVIPEDVTEATIVALREMRWRSTRYFRGDVEAVRLIRDAFEALIAAYRAEKPPLQLRFGFAPDQQGLQLPQSYAMAAEKRSRFVMKPQLAETEKQAVIRAAYRQVFERDVTREFGAALTDLESQFRSGAFSTKEFVRQLGHSRLYRDEFYEPFTISRVIELAVRHFLGRGLCGQAEFQTYFDAVSTGGLKRLVDAIVDSPEYTEYFGEETVPYLRGLGQEAQECRNWHSQRSLLKFKAIAQKVPQFESVSRSNQHSYGAGHDPIDPFSAVFPPAVDAPPVWVGQADRRILIGCEDHEAGNWGKVPGTSEGRSHHLSGHPLREANVDLQHHSPEAVIAAAYRQVMGREVLADQRVTPAEVKLKSGEITVREFVRRLAKSPLFRSFHWDGLYVTKAIESIHLRLLGRPTIGREELNRYYDICARQGFYALVDALIDSPEYSASFSEDTVPYERYVTPRIYERRSRLQPIGSDSPDYGDRVADGTWMKQAIERWQRDRSNGHVSPDAAMPEIPPLVIEMPAIEESEEAPPSGETEVRSEEVTA